MERIREEIRLLVSEQAAIVYDDSNEYELIESEITGTWRHGNENSGIIKRISDGKFFRIDWRDSPKDDAMFRDMNYSATFKEVFPIVKQIEITVYE